ncbi:hypothetical protein [Corynebacterium lizhenjunii]|uniref:hypothetical protein n=1 Tax=Corynebacterium lizhenjunii TaxID=2709394 RepID=UPI003CC82883
MKTTVSVSSRRVFPDLVKRSFRADETNHLHVGDVTYLLIQGGTNLYLATVIDCYSRRSIGFSIADHMRTDFHGQDDLTKIFVERDGRLPAINSSQSSAGYWLKALPNRVGADSLVSRISSGRHIEIGDFDMRKHLVTIRDNTNT